MSKKEIQRGDIYHANLNPAIGNEQGGFRPVLIVQNNRGNQYSPTVIVASITSRPKYKMSAHVTLLIGMGFLVVDVAGRMGHESIDITLHYVHMFSTA